MTGVVYDRCQGGGFLTASLHQLFWELILSLFENISKAIPQWTKGITMSLFFKFCFFYQPNEFRIFLDGIKNGVG